MRGTNSSWQARCVVTGLLFIIGVSPLLADPMVRQSSAPNAVSEESTSSESSGMLPVVRDALQEVRRTGPGVSPNLLGIDDGYLVNGSLLHSELRELDKLPSSKRIARNPDGSPDIFKEVVDDALKATRDALFDGADTAVFSLAGIELSLTLSGDRRALALNGIELLGPSQEEGGIPATEAAPAVIPGTSVVAYEVSVARQGDGEELNIQAVYANIRRFATHPMTIMVAIVLVGIWLVFLVGQSSRSRRS